MEKIIDCQLTDLVSESDVEQKFISPLLMSKPPLGLNYSAPDYKTKPSIKEVYVDKGGSKKLYYPDYIIVYAGLPLLIIEAKKPHEDLIEAYREARLYCTEINSAFPHGTNPCHKILVTNGVKSLCGYHDSEYLMEIEFNEINSAGTTFTIFSNFLSKDIVFNYGKEILKKIRGNTRFQRPLSLLGGKTIQNEELKENSFGSTLSLQFRYLFNPETYEEKRNIVLNAYVKTRRHLKHVDPIDKIIRATLPLSLSDIKKIEDTSQPIEVIKAIQKRMVLKNQLLILVGSVGSGKSTFTDYLREVAITNELKNETVWMSINLNDAPLNRNDIYNWLKQQVVNNFKRLNRNIDFDDFHTLKKIFAVEFNNISKTYGPLLGEESVEFKIKLADTIASIKADNGLLSNCYNRYFCSEKGKLLIIVLDNVDKRKLEDQLLMFEVASWLKENYHCLVFLPIRDTTFDNFRKEPPLDTVIKDFVFRIDPPLLREVILERIRYALREMDKTSQRMSFELDNGMNVVYPVSDQGFYLATIAKSLFESTYFSRLITGLAGRNIRKGLEIFLDFCKSGHLSSNDIFKIRQQKGQFVLPNHLISRIMLRGNKKYYSDITSNVKNIFYCSVTDANPDPFVRLSILRWLKDNFRKTGPTKNLGYHKISGMINDLISYGHAQERLFIEIEFLIKNKYAITESQAVDEFDIEDLISISASGTILLDLLNDISYLAACSEDIYYRESQVAESISKRCAEQTGYSLYSKETTVANAKELIEYLNNYKEAFLVRKPGAFIKSTLLSDYTNLDKQLDIITKTIQNDSELYKQQQYSSDTIIDGEIISVKDYGVFVQFGLESIGFSHVSELEAKQIDINDLQIGDKIVAKIKRYNSQYHKYDIEIMD